MSTNDRNIIKIVTAFFKKVVIFCFCTREKSPSFSRQSVYIHGAPICDGELHIPYTNKDPLTVQKQARCTYITYIHTHIKKGRKTAFQNPLSLFMRAEKVQIDGNRI
jgi:hypothetical protein